MIKSLVREEEFSSFLQNNKDKLVLVKFTAEWCGPCKSLQESIKKLLMEWEGQSKNLVVLEVNADRFPKLEYQDQSQKVQQLVVRSLPTLFLFRQGEMQKKAVGSMSVQQLREFIVNCW